jgi:hypothetical protein
MDIFSATHQIQNQQGTESISHTGTRETRHLYNLTMTRKTYIKAAWILEKSGIKEQEKRRPKIQSTHQRCQWKIIKKICEYLPYTCIAVPG